MQGLWEASGEIDFMAAPGFRAGMRCAIDEATDRDVFVDCSAVTFMDSAAYHAFVEANTYAIGHGHRLIIRNLRPNCSMVLDLCDTVERLVYEVAP